MESKWVIGLVVWLGVVFGAAGEVSLAAVSEAELGQVRGEAAGALQSWDFDMGTIGPITKAFPSRGAEWKRLAGEGVPEAMWLLGQCKISGLDGPIDVASAMRLYRAAGEAGYTPATVSLADTLNYGFAVKGQEVMANPESGVALLKSAMAKGDRRAPVLLVLLVQEKVLPASEGANVRGWLAEGVKSGSTRAAVCLGDFECDGQFGPVDLEASLAHYRLAVAAGSPLGEVQLGFAYERGSLEPAIGRDEAAARELYRKAAEAGYRWGMFDYACSLYYGRGGPVDDEGAVKWWKGAADLKLGCAFTSLGNRAKEGRGMPRDRRLAAEYYDRAARLGDPDGAVNLIRRVREGIEEGKPEVERAAAIAKAYAQQKILPAVTEWGFVNLRGLGVQKNPEEGVRLLTYAAEHGDRDGMYRLGCCKMDGEGTAVDVVGGIQLLEKSAAKGDETAIRYLAIEYGLGTHVGRDPAKARALAEAGARSSAADANWPLGYLNIHDLIPGASVEEGVRLLDVGASKADVRSAYELGFDYSNGVGVAVDKAKAMKYWRRASELGDANGTINLADALLSGKGVPADPEEALRVLAPLVARGEGRALNLVGVAHRRGAGVPQDDKVAVDYYRRSAGAGDANGMANYGWMLETGTGVERDVPEAVRWYRMAAEKGEETAAFGLVRIYTNGAPAVSVDPVEAVKWLRVAAKLGEVHAVKMVEALRAAGKWKD